MPSSPRPHVCSLAIAALLSLLGGCATSPPEAPEAAPGQALEPDPVQGMVPVVRYGRYTLVELVPDPVQQDLMQQVIDISMPGTVNPTVGDALRHVLLRSGYQLCTAPPDGPTLPNLYGLPLPAAHLRLGPLRLRDALLTLAGPAWDLQVDDGRREVCFTRHAEARNTLSLPATGGAAASPAPAASTAAVQTAPLPEAAR